MTEDLVIVGAGGFSRQIAELVEELNRIAPRWRLTGFLDDNPDLAGRQVMGYPVSGPLEAGAGCQSARFVIGIANYRKPDARRIVSARLGFEPGRYATLIHPSASVSIRAKVGPGTVILQNVVVSHDVVIGGHVLVSPGCVVGHGSVIGDFATFAAHVTLSGSCRIGPAAYLGSHSTVLEDIRVGEGALVGIGAVVLNDVAPDVTVFGNPAAQRWRRGQ